MLVDSFAESFVCMVLFVELLLLLMACNRHTSLGHNCDLCCVICTLQLSKHQGKEKKRKKRKGKERKGKERKERKRKEKKRKEKKRKEKKRKDYTSRRQFNEKPSIILGCPGPPFDTLLQGFLLQAVANHSDRACARLS